jgi:hypothetical protein
LRVEIGQLGALGMEPMEAKSLISRIEAETGVLVQSHDDEQKLFGILDLYRPHGVGLERLLSGDGVEGRARARIQRVFDATAQDWKEGQGYFFIKRHDAIDGIAAVRIAREYLSGFRQLANYAGHVEVGRALSSMEVAPTAPANRDRDDEFEVMMYECLTDFIRPFGRKDHEIFVLKEALYSIASDYFLSAYILWPAIELTVPLPGAMDRYFDMWRHGLKLKFFANTAVVELPRQG